jgi:putative membrane protein insertion efficiency factor
MMTMRIKSLLLKAIRKYQEKYSLDHGMRGVKYPLYRTCRFTPTCSEYSYEAIDKYGVVKGGFMGMWRFLRCNPLTQMGTYDPVPESKSSS